MNKFIVNKLIGFIMTAGHLDIEWYQPLRSYRFWTVEALEDLKTAAKRDDFTTYVLDGQVFPLEEYLEVAPEDRELMRDLIKTGKLAVGPFYTQFDEWLPSAENMIRNCLYGRRRADAFGGHMIAGYLPDNFGHPRQLPQILRNFGIDSLMFMRGMPEVEGGHPDEFVYRGLDGSEVLVCHFRESYAGAFDIFNKDIAPMQPRPVPYYDEYISYEYHRELADHDDPERIALNMISNVHRIRERFPSGVIPLVAGYDHLPPQINVGDSVRAANLLQDEIEFVMGTPEDYVKLVKERISSPEVYDMELIGSRYQYILLGALSTRSYLKRQNFACEILLEKYVEPLCAAASLYGYNDRQTLLDEAWRYMMINSAHDSIHGSSTDEVHTEMEARFAAVRQIASGLICESMAYIGRHIKRWWEQDELIKRLYCPDASCVSYRGGRPHRLEPIGVATYSPVTTDFMQPAEVWLPIGDTPIVIVDEDGELLPTQIEKREQIETNSLGRPRNDYYPHEVYRKVTFMSCQRMGRISAVAAIPTTSERLREICADSIKRDANVVDVVAKPDIGDSTSAVNVTRQIVADDSYIDNGLLRVDVAGAVLHITDKQTGRTYYNLNLIEEDADAGDAWDYSPTWLPSEVVRSSRFSFTSRLCEVGSVKAVILIDGSMSLPERLHGDLRSENRVELPMTFEVTVWRDTKRVDIKLTLDNRARDHRLRLRIPFMFDTDEIISQGQLAILRRKIERQTEIEPWVQPPTQLMPCREWIAASDGDCGLAVALKGMY